MKDPNYLIILAGKSTDKQPYKIQINPIIPNVRWMIRSI